MRTRGKLITLEGGEGVGKSTNLQFVADYLKRRNVSVLVTREPGGTPLGEALRDLLLQDTSISPEAELLLLFAARAQHLNEVIRPALAGGEWVLCDRFTDASHAYQGGGRGLDSQVIDFLECWLLGPLQPDLTLLLDAPVELGITRMQGRSQKDRFERENLEFFRRVRQAYLARATRFPERIRLIDAAQPIERVQAHLAVQLEFLFTGRHA